MFLATGWWKGATGNAPFICTSDDQLWPLFRNCACVRPLLIDVSLLVTAWEHFWRLETTSQGALRPFFDCLRPEFTAWDHFLDGLKVTLDSLRQVLTASDRFTRSSGHSLTAQDYLWPPETSSSTDMWLLQTTAEQRSQVNCEPGGPYWDHMSCKRQREEDSKVQGMAHPYPPSLILLKCFSLCPS